MLTMTYGVVDSTGNLISKPTFIKPKTLGSQQRLSIRFTIVDRNPAYPIEMGYKEGNCEVSIVTLPGGSWVEYTHRISVLGSNIDETDNLAKKIACNFGSKDLNIVYLPKIKTFLGRLVFIWPWLFHNKTV